MVVVVLASDDGIGFSSSSMVMYKSNRRLFYERPLPSVFYGTLILVVVKIDPTDGSHFER